MFDTKIEYCLWYHNVRILAQLNYFVAFIKRFNYYAMKKNLFSINICLKAGHCALLALILNTDHY